LFRIVAWEASPASSPQIGPASCELIAHWKTQPGILWYVIIGLLKVKLKGAASEAGQCRDDGPGRIAPSGAQGQSHVYYYGLSEIEIEIEIEIAIEIERNLDFDRTIFMRSSWPFVHGALTRRSYFCI